MRTDVSRQQTYSAQQSNNTCESVGTMKVRKTLHSLQEAAGDKENLVGAGRMPPCTKDADKSLKKISSNANCKIEKKKNTINKADKITAEDLTSQAGPSEHYWELLAERRRVALDEALEENLKLHERIAALEEENKQCRQLLEEGKALIDSLTGILNSDNESDQSIAERSFVSEMNKDEINQFRDE